MSNLLEVIVLPRIGNTIPRIDYGLEVHSGHGDLEERRNLESEFAAEAWCKISRTKFYSSGGEM